MLTHYTRTMDAVVNILEHGFRWMPNRRRLTELLIPQHDFAKREPQQFGMISFTEIEPECACQHNEVFGKFGIGVTDSWAREHQAQRVLYVNEQGPLKDALKELFAVAYSDLECRIKHPEDGFWRLAYENKAAARGIAGARTWACLLGLWEFLEPAANAWQREWRIVNPMPHYGLSEDKAEAIAEVSPPRGWAKDTHLIKVSPSDVVALSCPSDHRSELHARVSRQFSSIEIIEV
jgi:hypothetical protein